MSKRVFWTTLGILIAISTTVFAQMYVGGELRSALFERLSSDPSTGAVEARVYYNTDEKRVKLYDGADWVSIGSGTGSGEINYVESPDRANGWSSSEPSDLFISTTTTESEIPRISPLVDTAIKISPMGTGTGAIASTNVTVGEADRGKLLKVEWAQLVGPAFTAGDYLLEIRPATNDTFSSFGAPIPLSQWDQDNEYKIDALSSQLATFATTEKYLQVRIIQGPTTDDSSAWISLNTVTLGPGRALNGATISPRQDYNPSWQASSTNPAIGNGTITGYWKQIGEEIEGEISVRFGTTTTAGSGSYFFGLPPGFTPDLSRMGISQNAAGIYQMGGAGYLIDNSAGASASSRVVAIPSWDDNLGGIFLRPQAGTVWTNASPFTVDQSDVIHFYYRLPVVELRGKGVTRMLTPNELYQSGRASFAYSGSSTAISDGGNILLNTITATVPNVGGFTLSSNAIIVPSPGLYQVELNVLATTGAPINHVNSAASVVVRVNGSGVDARAIGPAGSRTISVSFTVYCPNAGDAIDFITNAATFTQADASFRHTTIARIPDRTEGSPIGVALATTEQYGLVRKPRKLLGLSQAGIANNSTTDIASSTLVLPAGTYTASFGGSFEADFTGTISSARLDLFVTDAANNTIAIAFSGPSFYQSTLMAAPVASTQSFTLATQTTIKMRARLDIVGGTITDRRVSRVFMVLNQE